MTIFSKVLICRYSLLLQAFPAFFIVEDTLKAKFTWFYYEMLKLNKDGARVLLKGKIDFAEHHYETECTVRWNESLSETAIKNASITSVVDSQEKELAAAI